MKIYLGSYQSLMINRGGPSFKIRSLYENLQKLDVDVELFDMWNIGSKISCNELFHIFTAGVGTYHLANNIVLNGGKYVVNPIFFNRNSIFKVNLYSKFQNILSGLFPGVLSDFSITKKICNQAIRVLPNTKAEGEILYKGLDIKTPMEVIPNGVEKRFADADSTLFIKKYNLKDFILYVGHLGQTRKNGLNFIKAASQIDHPVVIIANTMKNKEGDICLDLIAKSKNILHIPWLAHDDLLLSSAYAACKTFALPTLYETPGRAALEAGLASANIIITPFGGTKEYFRDLVDFVNPYSISDIVKSLEKSLNKPKNEILKQHILANYTWDKIAVQTLNMYKKVVTC